MQFAAFVPPQAAEGPVPVLTYLAGLTCTEETFMIKAGAQRIAAALGLMLIAPDTSPRGDDVPDDPDGAWDFGLGAGFYVDATASPWQRHYRMYSYVTDELPAIVGDAFPADLGRQGITGHSMGGHGALTIGLRNPQTYSSISAFAPVCSPVNCPWGQKAFAHYLGEDTDTWQAYDATEMIARLEAVPRHTLLIDQGLSDPFLREQLRPDLLESACSEHGVALEFRRHEGYDHGYFFIATFVEDHLRHHARVLLA